MLFDELITRGVDEVIQQESLLKKLKSGKKLRIKYGVDPTASSLHIGHGACLLKLREFQELGHKIIFLIGDFTARIGDPTDKFAARKTLSKKEVEKNMASYQKQADKILDLKKVEIKYNSEWLDKMSYAEFFRLEHLFTCQQLLERDMFSQRLKKQKPIWMHELAYPILQGYDSVQLKADLEVGGTDQKFNMLMAREIQPFYRQQPQDVMTLALLVGLDGRQKMSQSLGNDIKFNDPPDTMYGKIMSLPDEAVVSYFEAAARVAGKELAEIQNRFKNPKNRRDLKAELGREIVNLYHGIEQASLAEENFSRVFREGRVPLDIPEIKPAKLACEDLPGLLLDFKLVSSKSEARRLIEQGGVKIDQAVIRDPRTKIRFHQGMVIQVGKLKWVRVRF